MSEIIWYFFFSHWLIPLSIMFSKSIHLVTKGKIFFFCVAASILGFLDFSEFQAVI